jgi:hypothetical protein
MLKLTQPPVKVYKSNTPDTTYLSKVYCSKCDTKRTRPCECRLTQLKLNSGI